MKKLQKRQTRLTAMYGINVGSYSKRWNRIMAKYNDVAYLSLTNREIPYSIIYYDNDGKGKNTGYIYFNCETILHPSEEDLVDLLHEIGHIVTNKYKMKRCIEEYLATQFALDHAKEFNVRFSIRRMNEFQDYIYKWREISIKHNSKNIPSIEELKLRRQ